MTCFAVDPPVRVHGRRHGMVRLLHAASGDEEPWRQLGQEVQSGAVAGVLEQAVQSEFQDVALMRILVHQLNLILVPGQERYCDSVSLSVTDLVILNLCLLFCSSTRQSETTRRSRAQHPNIKLRSESPGFGLAAKGHLCLEEQLNSQIMKKNNQEDSQEEVERWRRRWCMVIRTNGHVNKLSNRKGVEFVALILSSTVNYSSSSSCCSS